MYTINVLLEDHESFGRNRSARPCPFIRYLSCSGRWSPTKGTVDSRLERSRPRESLY